MPIVYDNLGNPVGYEYDGAKYWYITNLQGDVLYVVNSAGTVIKIVHDEILDRKNRKSDGGAHDGTKDSL